MASSSATPSKSKSPSSSTPSDTATTAAMMSASFNTSSSCSSQSLRENLVGAGKERDLDKLISITKSVTNTVLTEAVSELSKAAVEDLWQGIYGGCTSALLSSRDDGDAGEDNQFASRMNQILKSITELALSTVSAHFTGKGDNATGDKSTKQKVSQSLHETVILLHDLLPNVSEDQAVLKNKMSLVCEEWWSHDLEGKSEMAANAFIFVLGKSTEPDAPKKDVSRVWSMRTVLTSGLLGSDDKSAVVSLLQECTHHPNYVTTPHGIKFLAFALSLNNELTDKLHQSVKSFIFTTPRSWHAKYGEVYYQSWVGANEEMKQKLEESCIQDLIYRGVHASRQGANSPSATLYRVLSYLHKQKSQRGVEVMLVKLYGPILWRSLKVPNSDVRLNASSLLFDVFPLLDPNLLRVETDAALQRQFDVINALLTDPVVAIRVRAVLGIGRIMQFYWELIPVQVIQTLMTHLVQEMMYDIAAPTVREAVLKVMYQLCDNHLCIPMLKKVLPELCNFIHDTSERVRVAMLDLLLKVKCLRAIKYWSIVPIEHILARLETDSDTVVRRIMNLIWASFVPVNLPASQQVERCLTLVSSNRTAARRFFLHLSKHLGVVDSAKYIVTLCRYALESTRVWIQDRDSSSVNTANTSSTSSSSISVLSGGGSMGVSLQSDDCNEDSSDGNSGRRGGGRRSGSSSTKKNKTTVMNASGGRKKRKSSVGRGGSGRRGNNDNDNDDLNEEEDEEENLSQTSEGEGEGDSSGELDVEVLSGLMEAVYVMLSSIIGPLSVNVDHAPLKEGLMKKVSVTVRELLKLNLNAGDCLLDEALIGLAGYLPARALPMVCQSLMGKLRNCGKSSSGKSNSSSGGVGGNVVSSGLGVSSMVKALVQLGKGGDVIDLVENSFIHYLEKQKQKQKEEQECNERKSNSNKERKMGEREEEEEGSSEEMSSGLNLGGDSPDKKKMKKLNKKTDKDYEKEKLTAMATNKTKKKAVGFAVSETDHVDKDKRVVDVKTAVAILVSMMVQAECRPILAARHRNRLATLIGNVEKELMLSIDTKMMMMKKKKKIDDVVVADVMDSGVAEESSNATSSRNSGGRSSSSNKRGSKGGAGKRGGSQSRRKNAKNKKSSEEDKKSNDNLAENENDDEELKKKKQESEIADDYELLSVLNVCARLAVFLIVTGYNNNNKVNDNKKKMEKERAQSRSGSGKGNDKDKNGDVKSKGNNDEEEENDVGVYIGVRFMKHYLVTVAKVALPKFLSQYKSKQNQTDEEKRSSSNIAAASTSSSSNLSDGSIQNDDLAVLLVVTALKACSGLLLVGVGLDRICHDILDLAGDICLAIVTLKPPLAAALGSVSTASAGFDFNSTNPNSLNLLLHAAVSFTFHLTQLRNVRGESLENLEDLENFEFDDNNDVERPMEEEEGGQRLLSSKQVRCSKSPIKFSMQIFTSALKLLIQMKEKVDIGSSSSNSNNGGENNNPAMSSVISLTAIYSAVSELLHTLLTPNLLVSNASSNNQKNWNNLNASSDSMYRVCEMTVALVTPIVIGELERLSSLEKIGQFVEHQQGNTRARSSTTTAATTRNNDTNGEDNNDNNNRGDGTGIGVSGSSWGTSEVGMALLNQTVLTSIKRNPTALKLFIDKVCRILYNNNDNTANSSGSSSNDNEKQNKKKIEKKRINIYALTGIAVMADTLTSKTTKEVTSDLKYAVKDCLAKLLPDGIDLDVFRDLKGVLENRIKTWNANSQ